MRASVGPSASVRWILVSVAALQDCGLALVWPKQGAPGKGTDEGEGRERRPISSACST